MNANEAKLNDKVWIRIGQGNDAPLCPGIVTDARAMDRPLGRSTAKGGTLNVRNSIVAISLRENVTPSNGLAATYFTERPEALIAVTVRETPIPAIDGDPKDSRQEVLARLRTHVGESYVPSDTHIKEEAARYLAMPALA